MKKARISVYHGGKFVEGMTMTDDNQEVRVGQWWRTQFGDLEVLTINRKGAYFYYKYKHWDKAAAWHRADNCILSNATLILDPDWPIEIGDQFEDYDGIWTIVSNYAPKCFMATNNNYDSDQVVSENLLCRMRRLPRVEEEPEEELAEPAPTLNQVEPQKGDTVWIPMVFVEDDGGPYLPWKLKPLSSIHQGLRWAPRPDRWHVGENLPVSSDEHTAIMQDLDAARVALKEKNERIAELEKSELDTKNRCYIKMEDQNSEILDLKEKVMKLELESENHLSNFNEVVKEIGRLQDQLNRTEIQKQRAESSAKHMRNRLINMAKTIGEKARSIELETLRIKQQGEQYGATKAYGKDEQ